MNFCKRQGCAAYFVLFFLCSLSVSATELYKVRAVKATYKALEISLESAEKLLESMRQNGGDTRGGRVQMLDFLSQLYSSSDLLVRRAPYCVNNPIPHSVGESDITHTLEPERIFFDSPRLPKRKEFASASKEYIRSFWSNEDDIRLIRTVLFPTTLSTDLMGYALQLFWPKNWDWSDARLGGTRKTKCVEVFNFAKVHTWLNLVRNLIEEARTWVKDQKEKSHKRTPPTAANPSAEPPPYDEP